MNCSVEQYIELCRVTLKEQKAMQKKNTILNIHQLLSLRSTSVIQIKGQPMYQNDSLGRKVIYYSDLERDVLISEKIIDLMRKTTELIDPSFSIHVMMTYMMSDNQGNMRFAKQEAEEFGYDRRVFKREMDQEIEKALGKPKMKELLNQIKQIAEKNGRLEYLSVFKKTRETQNSI